MDMSAKSRAGRKSKSRYPGGNGSGYDVRYMSEAQIRAACRTMMVKGDEKARRNYFRYLSDYAYTEKTYDADVLGPKRRGLQ